MVRGFCNLIIHKYLKMKIAIIGSGISGNAAAWLLSSKFDITVFEKNSYIGGHSNTVEIDYLGNKIAVDTGFIVFNHKTYPNLKKLFEILKVETVASDMSFGIKAKELEYSVRSLLGVFGSARNFFDLSFWRMIFDIIKFNKKAIEFVNNNQSNQEFRDISLEDFLRKLNLGKYFWKYFLLPMAGAIWSCPEEKMLEYPAQSFLKFYYNHGLLTLFSQPQWYSVKGGSKKYVELLTRDFKENIKVGEKIIEVKKVGEKILLKNDKNQEYFFDKVIFANHADEVLEICKSLPEKASQVLKNFKYQENLAVLHRDETQMPKRKSAWASWIYHKNHSDEKSCSVSYWMNLLQKIDEKYPIFVTLNPLQEIAPEKIFAKFVYHHPIFDENAIKAQAQIVDIQGLDGFYYCGAYQANGFHEDGLNSAINLAKLFGVEF